MCRELYIHVLFLYAHKLDSFSSKTGTIFFLNINFHLKMSFSANAVQ